MDTACLDYCLTDEEQLQFEQNGLLVVEDALSSQMVEDLTAVVDRCDAQYRTEQGLDPYHWVNLHDCIGKDDLFLELVDWPTTFPKVWGILGSHIQIYHTQMSVKPPSKPGEPPVKKRLGWHQDNSPMLRDMATDVRPRLSLKVAYFLTDTTELGRSNFYVVPGSHVLNALEYPTEDSLTPKGAMGMLVKAGSAVIFDQRLWHAGSQNFSNITRKVLFYGYSFRWLRTKSEMNLSHMMEACDPIRQQLLGASSSASGYFQPHDEDIPLRTWLKEHVGEDAAVS